MSPRPWLYLLLPVLALLLYLPGRSHPFVYDDHGVILENAFLAQPDALHRTLTLHTFTDPTVIDGQRPTLLLTYLLDHTLHRDAPSRWRLTNYLLHALVLIALAGLWMRLGLPPAWSGCLALLTGLHPLAVEAIHSPAFREDPLALLLSLAFLHLLILPAHANRLLPVRAAAASISFLLALLAKESALFAPALLIALRFLFPQRLPSWRALLPVLLLCAIATLTFLLVSHLHRPLQAVGLPWNGRSLLFPHTLLTAPWLLLDYLLRVLLPFGLTVDYVVPPVTTLLNLRGVTGLALLAFLALLWINAPTLSPRHPALLRLSIAWILLAFLPVSNLLPLFNPFADRYAYALLPGFALLIATLLIPRDPFLPRTLFIILLLAYALLTSHQLTTWRSDESLWTHTLRHQPHSDRAHTWLGLLEREAGNRDLARKYFQRARELNPHEVSAAVNLAILEGEAGRLQEAEQQLRDILARRPDHPQARANLAHALRLQGREKEAQSILAESP
ncbi:MAG TPA: tetratricopeptide repeat protein [Kiritimatiellia bacterium]|nr:tetratricopeptide repeat protein [Kiritimatiellia bacterium]